MDWKKFALVFLVFVISVVLLLFCVDLKVLGQFFWAVHEGIKEAYFGYGLYMNNQ